MTATKNYDRTLLIPRDDLYSALSQATNQNKTPNQRRRRHVCMHLMIWTSRVHIILLLRATLNTPYHYTNT